MCTTNEWREFNKDRSKKSLRDKVSNLILTDRFWKKTGEVQTIMEPLVKVLKLVDQDKKATLLIIYEAMDRAKLAIKASVKQWEKYWEVIDRRWESQLHSHLHAADEWIRKREEPILSSDNLDWLDKGLLLNEEVKAPRTISSSFSSDDGDNESSRWGGGTSGGSRGVGGTGEGTGGDGSTGGEGYSNTRTRASDSYGYDQSSRSSSIAYRANIFEEQLFQPYPQYGNYHPNLYTRRRTDDDDFEPPRHSTWN
ncbi:hypothetical protein CK203_024335 [Vitis vinifera]|uniref:DUF659 domain-containing protein n=1 Tax=Vitis vinifera TaxID=29760 RepID=A0A438IYE4_VITVI|nr:hypothetical protein CK203_024335 [Vitis vinifera]